MFCAGSPFDQLFKCLKVVRVWMGWTDIGSTLARQSDFGFLPPPPHPGSGDLSSLTKDGLHFPGLSFMQAS